MTEAYFSVSALSYGELFKRLEKNVFSSTSYMERSSCHCYFEPFPDAMRDSKENNTERARTCNLNKLCRLSAHEQKLILGKVDIYNLASFVVFI